MLTTEDLRQVKEYIFRELPLVLEQDPHFAVMIEGILAEKFPKRDEFARLLDELESHRLETRQAFKQVDKRFTGIDQSLERMDHRFDKIDKRLDGMDQRFVGVDQRFDQMDQRFVGVDQRFDQMDQRFDQMDQRFVGVDQRFDQMDQRFVDIDQRFVGVDQRFVEVEGKLDTLSQEMRDLRDWVELTVGRLQTRSGRNLEDVVAGALRLGLQQPDIQPAHIRLRQKIQDVEGVVFKAGKQKEVDIVARNGNLLVFEVKSAPDSDDVEEFADKVELMRHLYPDKHVEGVFISLGAKELDDVREACQQRQIRLIP